MSFQRAPAQCLFSLTVAFALGLGPVVLADTGPSTARLGKKIDNFTLQDAAGKAWALHNLKDRKAVVVVFLSFECPVSNSYTQSLADLATDYAKQGVAFIGICTNDEDAAWVARNTRDYKLPFPVFRHGESKAADALKAEVTPEALVLDSEFVLRYRGRIDNGYSARLKRNPRVTRHDLREALDDILAGKVVSTPATQAVGCPIRCGAAPRAATGLVTYHRDVLPILQRHCQVCHRPGEVGPFSLLTHKQAVNWAADIKEFTQARKMPPWKPVDGPAFRDERRLTDQEIATLAAWVNGGMPEGEPKDAPPPRSFTQGWHLGQPDLVLTVPEDFQLGPSGRDHFRFFVLPTNLTEDKYVTAVEVRPGNPRVVHHAVVTFDTSGRVRQREQEEKARPVADTELDRGPGFPGFMGSFRRGTGEEVNIARTGIPPLLAVWAPGQVPRHLPEGVGHLLPKGADLVMQLHYSRSGRVEKDRTSIGLYFAKQPAAKRLQTLLVPALFFSIPAGQDRYRVRGSVTVEQDCVLHRIFPHMHLLGKEIVIRMTPPGGEAQTLLAVKDWDFNWQETYSFKAPIAIRVGTRFDVEGVFDNSARNPFNPHSPPKTVFLGQQTTDEMCVALLEATSDQPGRLRFRLAGLSLRLGQGPEEKKP